MDKIEKGDILTATDICKMEDGDIAFTIGKEYVVMAVTDDEISLESQSSKNHFFDLNPASEHYYGKWLKRNLTP